MPKADFASLRRAFSGVSSHELQRYACGELSAARRQEIETLLGDNEQLQAQLDDIEADKRAFQVQMPYARFAERQTPKARFTWLRAAWFAPALAIAAALLVFVTSSNDTERTKGSDVEIGFLVRAGDGVRTGWAGESLPAGTQIQFTVKGGDGAMVILGIDGKGVVSTYLSRAAMPRQKGAHNLRAIDSSLILDEAVVVERFFVVFGGASADAVRQAAEQAAAKMTHRDLTQIEALPLGDGFQQSSVHIVKVR